VDQFERFRRYLGIPVPYSMILVVSVLGTLWEWVMKYFSNAAELRRELSRRKEQYLEADVADREDACDRILGKGRLILEMRLLHGKYAWDSVLRELHISRRTAGNYMALYLFSANHPLLYERFRRLGPTKLYRLARVAPDRLKNFTLETPVPTTDGMVALGAATDRQLESFLRDMFPPQKRTRAEKVREAASRITALTAKWPHDEAVSLDALESASSAVHAAAAVIAGMTTLARGAPSSRPSGAAEAVTNRRAAPPAPEVS
jgi:hypothetical protein